jgi:SAM-dependent methyltransferase
LSIAFLTHGTRALTCERCAARYPIRDDVPVILSDRSRWRARRPDDAVKLRAFAAPNRSPLATAVRAIVAGLEGDVLDLGCGGGALYDRRDVVGVDASLAMARAFGPAAIVADAGDPPFEPRRFDAVLLLNVLDDCPHPRLVLAQADALLRSGGTLVISCPYAWSRNVPERQRFSPADLVGALRGTSPGPLVHARYRIVRHTDRLPWRLTMTARLIHEYACQLIVARKIA